MRRRRWSTSLTPSLAKHALKRLFAPFPSIKDLSMSSGTAPAGSRRQKSSKKRKNREKGPKMCISSPFFRVFPLVSWPKRAPHHPSASVTVKQYFASLMQAWRGEKEEKRRKHP